MEDWFNMLMDYGIKIIGVTSVEGWLLTAAGSLMVLMWAYFKSTTYQDNIVSKRKIQARRKELVERAQKAITVVFEDAVKQQFVTERERDWIYKKLQKGWPELKELGTEPSFGKPWYYGPAYVGLKEVKGRVIERLLRMGLTTHELWSKKKRIALARANGTTPKTASEDLDDLVKAIRSKPKT